MTAAQRIRKDLIKNDSFVDDFSFGRIKRTLTMTYNEGKKAKQAAMEKAGGKSKIREQNLEK